MSKEQVSGFLRAFKVENDAAGPHHRRTVTVGLGMSAMALLTVAEAERRHLARNRQRAGLSEGVTAVDTVQNHPDYLQQASIFTEQRLKNERIRELLPRAAIGIYMATVEEGTDQVIGNDDLARRVGIQERRRHQGDRRKLDVAIGHLEDRGLVSRRRGNVHTRKGGYYATDALIWLIENGVSEPLQAVAEEWEVELPTGNSQNPAESPTLPPAVGE